MRSVSLLTSGRSGFSCFTGADNLREALNVNVQTFEGLAESMVSVGVAVGFCSPTLCDLAPVPREMDGRSPHTAVPQPPQKPLFEMDGETTRSPCFFK